MLGGNADNPVTHVRSRQHHFAAKLVGFVSFAFSDALDFGRVNAVALTLVLLLLLMDLLGRFEQLGNRFGHRLQLAFHISNHSSQVGA